MTSLPPPNILDEIAPAVDVDVGTSSKPRWIIGLTLLIGSAVLVSIWVAGGRRVNVTYITQPATRGDLTVTVTATGTLEPTNQVEVGSEISGKVANVLVDYNDPVKVGQVLARIDTTRLAAQVKQSRAALAAAEAKIVESEATRVEANAQLNRLTRMRELTQDNIPSGSDLDGARAAFDRAAAVVASSRALVLQSRATLEAQETDLSKAVIRSPINGVVLQRSVEAGQTVAASLQAPVLFVLAEDLTQMELHVDVDEADVSAVKAGQRATFTVDAFPDRQFVAQVTEVHFGARTVSGVVTYETVLTVDNAGLVLRPGMTATANIVVNEVRQAVRVPNAALRFAPASEQPTPTSSGGGLVGRLMPHLPTRGTAQRAPASDGGLHRVWILDANQPVAVDVRTGATDGVNTEILTGDIKEGTPVIVDSSTPEK